MTRMIAGALRIFKKKSGPECVDGVMASDRSWRISVRRTNAHCYSGCSLVTGGELLCLFGPLIGAVLGLHAPGQHVLEHAVGNELPLGVPDCLERHHLVHGERSLEVGGHVGRIGAPGYERG